MRTGIVLAGGRSERFGEDKLAARIGERSMLATTIAAIAGVVDGVIVAGPNLPSDREAWGDATPIALIRDRNADDGPLAALANVLASATPSPNDLAIVVGGDMPGLVPAVLRTMLERLDGDASIDAVILARGNAELDAPREVLPLAVRVQPAGAAARTAIADGRRSLQALLDGLAWSALPASEWLVLDPEARTLLDVDTRADMDRLRSGKGR